MRRERFVKEWKMLKLSLTNCHINRKAGRQFSRPACYICFGIRLIYQPFLSSSSVISFAVALISSFTSAEAFLNLRIDLPIASATSGSLRGPKKIRTMTRMIRSSDHPRGSYQHELRYGEHLFRPPSSTSSEGTPLLLSQGRLRD